MAEYKNIKVSSGGLRGFGVNDRISGITVLQSGIVTFSSSFVFDADIDGGYAEARKGTQITRVNVISGGILKVVSATVSSSVLIGEVSDGHAVSKKAGHQMLSAGAKAYDTIVSSGGNQAVCSGAFAYDTEIYSYGQQHVQKGAVASGVIMHSGIAPWSAAYHLVEGVAYDTVVYAYGDHYVRHGGVTYRSEIYDKAWQTVGNGGVASGTTIYSGGLQGMYGAGNGYGKGRAYDTVISSGGMQAVESGYAERTTAIYGVKEVWDLGSALSSYISAGTQIVAGYAEKNYVYSNGVQRVVSSAFDSDKKGVAESTGYAVSNTFSNAKQYVIDGIALYNSFQGGSQTVQGGSAVSNTLSGADQWIAGGVALSNTLSGGKQVIQGGSVISNTLNGVTQIIYNGKVQNSLLSSGAQTIFAGSAVSNTLVSANQSVSGGVVLSNTLYAGAQSINGGEAVNNDLHYANQTVWNGFASNTVMIGGVQKIVSGYVKDTVITNGSQLVQQGTSAFNTTVNGGYVKLYNSSLASGTILSGNAKMEVYGGIVKDLVLNTGTVCDFWQKSKGSGVITVAGKLSIHDGSLDGDVLFRVNGDQAADYMLDRYDAAADYAVSVSKYAGNGTYTLIGNASSWNENFTIYAGDQSYGTLKLDQTVTRGNRSYTLKLEENSLKLTIAGRNAAGYSSDINGDHFADLLMAHTKQGFAGAWKIGEDQKASWGDLSNLNGAWKIFAMGNTANDSFNDIYLYDEKANKIGAWVVGSGGKVTGWKDVATVNANMDVLGLGDFDGDRISDLLLRSGTGDIGFLSAGKKWQYLKGVGEEWTIGAIGDFNGDGRDDLALAHDAGFAGCFLTNADGTVRWSNLDKLNGSEIAGSGDFNGDGVDDVLLKKGDFYGAWIVEEGNAKSWMSLGTLKAGNSVEQIADFNGDGVDDLRVRTASGDLGVLCVNGANSLEWHYYGSVGSEWDTSLAATV